VVAGIAKGCELSGCALIGGETAEMPGMYPEGEYDLAGFAVGVVERDGVIDGRTVAEGDALVGVASTGVHSNGYSLVRRIVEKAKLDLRRPAPGLDRPLGDVLLAPTRLYPPLVDHLRTRVTLKAIAHITGGGLLENPPRVIPAGLGLRFDRRAWPEPPVFDLLRRAGEVPEPEMIRTFNLGLGLVVAVAPAQADATIAALAEKKVPAWKVGSVVRAVGEDRVFFDE